MENISSWKLKFEPCSYSNKLINKLSLLNTMVNNSADIQEVKKAIYYAKKYHGEQKRQSGEPYYSHPIEVAYMLAEYTAEYDNKYFRTDLLVTSVLHDTIEDTEFTFEMIKTIFGEIVAGQVADLTRIRKNSYKISSADMVNSLWLQKKYDILLIKLFDRLHNLQTIGAKSPEKIKKIVNETFNSFIVFAMCTQNKNLEKEIYQLCCKILSIEMIPYEFPQITQDHSHLIFSEGTDIHQYLSLVFQNVTTPIKN